MRILYYTWHEWTYQDCIDCMREQGWYVDVVEYRLADYDMDEGFKEYIGNQLLKEKYDCFFSFNYYPVISRLAKEYGIKYISWVFDTAHYTLDSLTLEYDCNEVFLFDHYSFQKYYPRGAGHIHYMPLAYHKNRIKQLIDVQPKGYEHEVTFLGNLYDDENNFLDQIRYLPSEMKGYIDGIIESQLLIYGYDLLDKLFDKNKCEQMGQFVNADMGELYHYNRDDIFRNMIRKKMTVIERKRVLAMIGERYPLDVYASTEPVGIQMNYCGYVDYITQMPVIFYKSKINLNISVRTNITGLPLRIIDVLGAGGFLLTNYQPEMSEYFKNGQELVWYEDKGDLIDKIDFYLKHDEERERIAKKGHEKAAAFFTYQNLLPEIFRIALG